MSCIRCIGRLAMMSLRITVCTSASAPAHRSVEPGARHGVAGGDDRWRRRGRSGSRCSARRAGDRSARSGSRPLPGRSIGPLVDLDDRRPTAARRGRRGGRGGSRCRVRATARMWSTTALVPTGPTIVSGVGCERHHPAGGDHVVEVGDVVAVQVGEQHRREVRARRGRAAARRISTPRPASTR